MTREINKESKISINNTRMKKIMLKIINKALKSKECSHLKPEMKILFALLWLYLKNWMKVH
jgi:hypothetical protein